MDWDRLHAFLAVAREGSFSRAARALSRTQPAISQSIEKLESELGQRVFVRDRRRTRPTAAGLVLLEHATRALAELEQGLERVQALQGLRAGRLRLGTTDTYACYVLPPVFKAFRARYPKVELALENRPSPAIAELVRSGEVDLGFVTLPERPRRGSSRELEGLRVEAMLRDENVLICAPRHPLAKQAEVEWSALLRYPLLLLHRETATRRMLDERLTGAARQGAKKLPSSKNRPDIVMETGSIEVIKKLVALDFGISVVPRSAVAHEVTSKQLAAARLGRRGEFASLGFVAARESVSPATEAFMDIAKNVLGDKRRE